MTEPAEAAVPAAEDTPLDERQVALLAARLAAGKRAENIVILEVENLIAITSYFVICSGVNRRQVRAIAEEISLVMKRRGLRQRGLEGHGEASWVLIDLGDVIVHVFLQEMREYYDLELHWGDAPRLPFDPPAPLLDPSAPDELAAAEDASPEPPGPAAD